MQLGLSKWCGVGGSSQEIHLLCSNDQFSYKLKTILVIEVSLGTNMMTSSNFFPRYWPFVWGIHRSRWIPRTKTSDVELWCFLCCVWINGWVNNWKAGDLGRHRTHYDVSVMDTTRPPSSCNQPVGLLDGVICVLLRPPTILLHSWLSEKTKLSI